MFHQNSPEIWPPSRLILIAPAGAMCRRRPFALAQKGGRKPINAKCETDHDLPTFRDAYRLRRCIVPVDGFFEWKAIKGQGKQPYAIAMKDGSLSVLAGCGRTGKTRPPASGRAPSRSSPTDANELVAEIHDRMPLIHASGDYDALAERRAKPARPDATIPSRADADVADLD